MTDIIKLATEANNLFFSGEYKKALSIYYKILSEDIDNSTNYYNIGITYEMLNEYELAVSYYKKSIRINNYIRSVDNLARIYIDVIKDFNIAKEYLDFAIKSVPNDAEAYNLYSRICVADKDYDMAEKYLKKSIFYDDKFFKNYYDIASVYYELKNKEKADENIKKCIELNNSYAPAKELAEQIKTM